MDMALLDVCVRDRCGDIFAALPDFSASAGVKFFRENCQDNFFVAQGFSQIQNLSLGGDPLSPHGHDD